MATHDYVIDNGTGSAVRADLNLLFKAILTNNSGTTDPSTVISSDAGSKAFSFWADTHSSPAVLKIRNAADDGWIELFQLDGTITLEDGSASAPALAFRDDLNTGIFSSAADTFNVATGGVERMELGTTTVFNEDGADVDFRIEGDTEANLFYVDAGNNHIGINDSTPSVTLDITGEGGGNGEVHVKRTSGASCFIQAQSATAVFGSNSNHAVSLKSNSTTALTIDTSQRVGIGTTSPSNMLHLSGTDPIIQFTDTAGGDSFGLFASHTNYLGFYNFTDSRVDMVIDGSGRVLVGHTTSTPMDNDANNPIFAVEGAGNGARIAVRSTDATAGNGAFVYLTRTRGTSAGSKTTVQSGDSLGGLIFMGADGTHDTRGAIIQAQVDGAVGDNDMPARLVFMTTSDGGINPSERMRLDSNGRLLIQETTTADVNANLTVAVGGASLAGIVTHSGTTANRHALACCNDNGHIGGITTSGSATSFNTSSDYRLKENATAISDGISRLKTLKPYRFNWKVDSSTTVDGFFAHEVTAVPEAITGTKDEVVTQAMIDAGDYEEGTLNDPIYQGIDQSKLVPLLVAAVKELITKVETLEAA